MKDTLKTFAFLFLLVFTINTISASLGTFQINECVDIRVLANCSSVNLTEVNDGTTTFVINSAMTNLGGQTFNYSFCNTSTIGTYSYSWNNPCVDCATNECGNSFEVTGNGKEKPEGVTVVFFVVVFLLLLITATIMMLKTIGLWVELNVDLLDVAWDLGIYFAVFALYYLSTYYLGNSFIEDILLLSVKVGAITHVFVPISALATTMIMNPLRLKGRKDG